MEKKCVAHTLFALHRRMAIAINKGANILNGDTFGTEGGIFQNRFDIGNNWRNTATCCKKNVVFGFSERVI